MIVEEPQKQRLKSLNINIKTIYLDSNKHLQRNTDNSKNDDIKNGIILEKDYYHNGILLKKENVFDSRIFYSYQFNDLEEVVCKNCGMRGNILEFQDGCPYCKSSYNIEYQYKELGSKHFYDLIVKDRSYIIKTLFIDIVVSFLISLYYVLTTSRTLYLFDILKIAVWTVMIGLILFVVFYYLDALFILPSIKEKKEEQNAKQEEFWKKMQQKNVDKIKLFNNLNYDLRKLYYSDKYKDIIDFDIIDYLEFKDLIIDNNLYIDISVDIRIIKFKNNKVLSSREEKKYRLKRISNYLDLKGGTNLIKCPGCGASVDVTKGKCSYCNKQLNYYQEWYLEKELD